MFFDAQSGINEIKSDIFAGGVNKSFLSSLLCAKQPQTEKKWKVIKQMGSACFCES